MLNEFSTNESRTQSPSKNLKEIEKKDIKFNFSNFPSFNENFFKNQILSQKRKNEQICKISKTKRRKRVFKKIIKKKIICNSFLLDFDFILKELFQNKNLNNLPTIKKKEKTQFSDVPKKENINKNNNIFLKEKDKSKKKNIIILII